ncbi:hypothetical protein CLF_101363 [Clonorchis sinensis]|uniref:Uncharacterized protein n=1 Tax=Clonorchis sinensis TaxID=79923 RepID=G7Y5K9_CLOSI|nr:hypothetical protein CLF_101363 [Clonorchis sinensis]
MSAKKEQPICVVVQRHGIRRHLVRLPNIITLKTEESLKLGGGSQKIPLTRTRGLCLFDEIGHRLPTRFQQTCFIQSLRVVLTSTGQMVLFAERSTTNAHGNPLKSCKNVRKHMFLTDQEKLKVAVEDDWITSNRSISAVGR